MRYRSFQDAVTDAREAWVSDLKYSKSSPLSTLKEGEVLSRDRLLTFHASVSHPFLESMIARLRLKSPRRRAATAWFSSYVAHPSALAFLALGALGLLLVQVQLAILKGPVREMAHSRAADGAGELSQSVASELNASLKNASFVWAVVSNERITGLEDRINGDLVSYRLRK